MSWHLGTVTTSGAEGCSGVFRDKPTTKEPQVRGLSYIPKSDIKPIAVPYKHKVGSSNPSSPTREHEVGGVKPSDLL